MRKTGPINLILTIVLVGAAMLVPEGTTRMAAALAPASSLPPGLQFTLLTGGLTDPVFVTNAHDGSGRLFIVEQTGKILIWNGSLVDKPFLDISGLSGFTGALGEQGLLGLAFDPNYATNGRFYITYTTNSPSLSLPYTTTLARYQVSSGNADVADPATAQVLLSIPKEFVNHNGGMIAFGPDGYLYLGMGDGGSAGDPDNNGQNLTVLLGKLLRIDVEHQDAGLEYAIPATNPFVGQAGKRGEIWAYGLRNPWRFSFDSITNNLFIADVGQDTEEEVDFQAAAASGGQNYGWSVLEGNLCFKPSSGCVPPASYVPPVAVYDHGVNDSYGCSITGGYVYRGSAWPRLQGVYLYGDYCSGKVLGLVRNADNSWTYGLIATTPYAISSFGVGEDGEMYLTDLNGSVYHISAPEQVISGNAGSANATLSYNDSGYKMVAADGSGAYTLNVQYGWSGRVAPFKLGFAFTPSSKTYAGVVSNQTNQDYVATSLPLAGTYDDSGPGWNYSGTWLGVPVSGAYNNTLHLGFSPGNSASFSFYGDGFTLHYLQYPNWGEIEVYLDGAPTPIATIDSNGPAGLPTYTSPVLIPGPHIVTFRQAGPAGAWIGIDSLDVRTPPIEGSGTYDDGALAWSYAGTWVPFPITGAYDNTLHIGANPGSSATLLFHGTGFSLTYLQYPGWGGIAVFIDQNPQPAAVLDSNGAASLPTYVSPVLLLGDHAVTIAHAGPPGTFVAVDALTVSP